MLISFSACSGVNYDITKKDNIYDDMYEYISNPNKYAGKTVKLSAMCVPVYNFSQNKIARYSVVVYDDDSDMRAVYEIRSDDQKYPKTGTVATLSGTFTEGYIKVSEYIEATFDDRTVDVEAVTRNADEMKTLINTYRNEYESSKYYGKTVRIYGNVVMNNGYPRLTGLDKKGAYQWDIELRANDASVAIPTENTNYVNTYEIIGVFDTYVDDNIKYACITVKEIIPIEGVLYVEETETDYPMTNPFT